MFSYNTSFFRGSRFRDVENESRFLLLKSLIKLNKLLCFFVTDIIRPKK